jgi:hypothetical protein
LDRTLKVVPSAVPQLSLLLRPARRAALALALAAHALGGCSSSSPSSDAPPVVPAPACADGFSSEANGFCAEVAPLEACPAGTRPKIGSAKCEAVGWTTSCPVGFARDPSGWGCTATVSEAACAGASRQSIGGGACVAIGDCGAAFPPAGALVVDARFTDPQLDATHFRKIADAITAAPSGATIAIESGTYAEDLTVGKSLSIVGRCAEKVILAPSTPTTVNPGIVSSKGAATLDVRGLTVKGHYGGIDVYEGTTATIAEVIVDGASAWGIIVDGSSAKITRSRITGTVISSDNRGGWGISAGASDVTVDDVEIVGGTDAVYAGTTDTAITVSRLVAHDQAPQRPNRSSGVYARGGRITVESSLLYNITGDAALAAELAKGIVAARNTVMRNIMVGGTLARGYGAVAFNGGQVTLRDCAIVGAESVGLAARDTNSIASAFDTVILGPPQTKAVPDENLIVSTESSGIGATATGHAKLNLDGVAIVRAWGWGVYADTSAAVDLKHTLIGDVRALEPKRSPALPFAIGLAVGGSSATVDDVSVLGTLLAAVTAGNGGTIQGKGLYVRGVAATDPVGTGAGIAVGDGGQVDLEASAIVDSTTSGILATRGGDATIRLARSAIHGTKAASQGFGHGVIVAAGAEIVLESTSIFDNAAIGLAAAGGRARVVGAVIARNPVGVHVQDGSFLVESPDAADPGANEVRVSPDTRFLSNTSKIGAGQIPLPSNILP